jgi:hypothetical protein
MSGQRFDDLTKSLANGASRRTFLKGFLSVVGGAALGVGSTEVAAAAGTCKTQGQSCTSEKCCRGYTCLVDATSGTDRFCCANTLVCAGHCCPQGASCVSGKCVCPAGQVPCSTTNPLEFTAKCVDLQSDLENCGACNHACSAPPNAMAVCAGGQCDFVCNAGFTRIGDVCCPNERVCGTTCLATACDPTQCQVCDPASGTCVSTCKSGETCLGGVCCPDAKVCGNTCLATACSATNCEVCDPTQGKCVSTCTAGQTCLGGACCPTTNVCGNTCLATACSPTQCQVCDPTQGKCVSTCATGEGCCSGVCKQLNTASNCGSCGNACGGTTNFCCPAGSTRALQCKRPTGATCSNNNQCCNSCSSGKCT